MNEIRCPKCGEKIEIEKTAYESIAKQVHDNEFKKEISQIEQKYLDDKNKELNFAKAQYENSLKLKDAEKDIAVSTAINEKEKLISDLNNQLLLKNDKMQAQKDAYEEKLKVKDEEIAYYKDFKARQSTKMIGESLEQHCLSEFNKLRPLFPGAYFEKDNDARTGSKGDFIFRDYDDTGDEYISIMFEMKNEGDETASKHKNEDFFKELDKDRCEKGCEYAVLVSMLEMDNETYNNGITDVSHKYDKMYVIRPQFFIPIITLIRNLGMKSLEYKKKLILAQNQNIDITNFENAIESFKDKFTNNCNLADAHFDKTLQYIDTCIDTLTKAKEELLKGKKQLNFADNKMDDLTITKLTNNNQTMKDLFSDLNKKKDEK